VTASGQQSRQPQLVVEEFIAARNAHDRERAASLLTADFEWRVSPSAGPPLHGQRAKDALVGGLSKSLTKPGSEHRVIERITADGGAVLVEYRITATTVAGREYTNNYCWMYDVRDGLIARIATYSDSLGGWRAFGAETVTQGLAAIRKNNA
jgi:ketosteroid isomerase-like protein